MGLVGQRHSFDQGHLGQALVFGLPPGFGYFFRVNSRCDFHLHRVIDDPITLGLEPRPVAATWAVRCHGFVEGTRRRAPCLSRATDEAGLATRWQWPLDVVDTCAHHRLELRDRPRPGGAS
jgi:hypothetical protein